MANLLFYEPEHTGHHYPYLARMLPGFIHPDVNITVATTQAGSETDHYDKFLKPLSAHFTLVTDCVRQGQTPYKIASHRVKEIGDFAQRYDSQYVVAAYADGLWQVQAMRSLLPWPSTPPPYALQGILYRGEFSYPQNNRLSHKLKRFLFRRLVAKGIYRRLMLDDELLFAFAESLPPSGKTKTDLAVNPVASFDIDRAAARQRLDLPAQGRIVSLSGVIDNRKGADLLTHAFIQALESGLTDTTLLLAGPHYDDIKAVLAQPQIQDYFAQGRIRSIDRLLNEQDMFSVAAASDLVVAPYPNHSGRSSIVLWAAAAGIPVLTTNRGCIDYVVQKERLGRTCDVRDISAFSAAIRESLDANWSLQDAQRSQLYAQWHSIEHYQRLNAEFIDTSS